MSWLGTSPRRGWVRLHRALGLWLGAAFVLLGLSGSLLVFYVEIDRVIEPALRLWAELLDLDLSLGERHQAREIPQRLFQILGLLLDGTHLCTSFLDMLLTK